ENEQRYWRMKRRLTNRALGQGVVWGLRLRWDHEHHRFLLGPGYAIDCCGNDLVVESGYDVRERDLFDTTDPLLRQFLYAKLRANQLYNVAHDDAMDSHDVADTHDEAHIH